MEQITNDLLKIKFDGETHDINLLTFSKTLANLNTIINEINKEKNKVTGLDSKVDIRVRAISPGSFEVTIDIVQVVVENLLNADNVAYFAGVVTIIAGLFEIRKFLRGQKPSNVKEEKNKIEIKNNLGQIKLIENNTYHIYQTSTMVNEALSDTYTTLSSDPKVTAFNLIDKTDKPVFSSDRSQFNELSEIVELKDDDRKVSLELTTININKICFEKDYKWQFYYKGYKITAAIKDYEFFKRINEGEKFSKGDSLEVELKTIKEFSSENNTYINKTYEVTKVLKHIPRPIQNKLSI
jgi:hypothetical protein